MRCITLIFVCCFLALTSAENGCPMVVQCLGNVSKQVAICQKLPAPNATATTNNTCETAVKQLQVQLTQLENQRDMTFQQCLTQNNANALNIQTCFCRNITWTLMQPKNYTVATVSSSSSTTVSPMRQRQNMYREDDECWNRVTEMQMECEVLYECCSLIKTCRLNFLLSANFTAIIQEKVKINTQEQTCMSAAPVPQCPEPHMTSTHAMG